MQLDAYNHKKRSENKVMTAICQLSATMKITVRTTFAKFPTIAGRMSRKSPVTSLASLITLVISEPVVRFVKIAWTGF